MSGEIKLEDLINLLSEDDKIELLRRQLKMKPVVDIKTFITDPYYLGQSTMNLDTGECKVYQCWYDRLTKEVYPNQFKSPTFIVNKGAIGTGKSTMAKIMLLYDMYRITRMDNPSNFFQLMDKPIYFAIYNVAKWKAQVMVNETWEMVQKSPYFQEQYSDPNSTIHRTDIIPCGRVQDFISNDILSAVLSELNFASPWVATDIINTAVSRVESRFQKGLGIFAHVVLDCSDTTTDSPVEHFCQYSPYAKNALIFSTSIWDAKPWAYGKKGWFRVYAGSDKVKAHIMEDGEDETELDQDRIFEAPMELHDLAESDIDKFLQEKAGRSIVSTDQFLDPEKFSSNLFSIPITYKEIDWVDFFNPDDTYISRLEDAINRLPTDRQLFGRIDLGVANDRAGFSVGYIEDLHTTVRGTTTQYDPDICIPIAIGFSRLPGQETSIQKLVDLVLYINSKVPFYSFTTDTYQSTQIRQQLKTAGLNVYALSVDRTDEAYVTFKNLIYRNKVRLANNYVLKNELTHLKRYDNKIDHPQFKDASGQEGTDSKDIADAVAGIVLEMTKANDSVMELPIKSNPNLIEDYNKILEELTTLQNKAMYINRLSGQF